MRRREWTISPIEADWVESVCAETGICPILATVLYHRNVRTPKEIYQFLSPRLSQVRSPYLLKDMEIAAKRISDALISNKKIMIFGDYDVDGITATAVMSLFLTHIGAHVLTYVPSRLKEGYGLRPKHIDIAASNGVHLIITVDCGSSSTDAIEYANKHGIGVIITDHHEVDEIPRDAIAAINPKQEDCTSGLSFLSGVGVAYYTVLAVRKELRDRDFFTTVEEPNVKELCDLVALGTIADVVPMVAENRIFTRVGLTLLRKGERAGLAALMREARLHPSQVSERDVAFSLAPRLNAAGRITHAQESVSLLIEQDPQTAEYLSQRLDTLNAQRRKIEKTILNEVHQQIIDMPDILQRRALVLYGDNWHQGVLGIVASRAADRYQKPSLVFSVKEGLAKGSGRSCNGIDLYQALTHCADLFIRFGGHANAAGILLAKENIPLLIERLETILADLEDITPPSPELVADCEVSFQDITPQLLENLEQLQPFGPSNQEPVFIAKDVYIQSWEIVGARHVKMMLTQAETANTFTTIQFHSTEVPETTKFSEIAFHLRWNYWNGKKTPQLVMVNA